MLINCFHHPLLHDASWVRTMNVDIGFRLLILESDTRTRCTSFRMLCITEMGQQTYRFFISKVLRFLLESLNLFFFRSHNYNSLGTKVLILVLIPNYYNCQKEQIHQISRASH